MIAKYNKELYEIVENGKNYEIITYQSNKAGDGFIKDRNLYFKLVLNDDIMLTDVFSVEFVVGYNTEIPSVQREWKISLDEESVKAEKVKLRFAEGYLPGWEVEEKGVCVKEIDMRALMYSKMVYNYRKKNGKKCDMLCTEEKVLSIEELKKMYYLYRKGNI